MQSLVQSTRLYVYGIVDTLVHTYRDHLKDMGEQFLSSYAVLASGEKDPRNLLSAFKIARVILTDFDISKHVEVSTQLRSNHRKRKHHLVRARATLTSPSATIPSLSVLPQTIHMELAPMISKIRSGMFWRSLFPILRFTCELGYVLKCTTGAPLNRACLSATPAFGCLGMTLFLEKLVIGSAITKVCVSYNNYRQIT